jgi:hypothetical protein
VCAPHALLVLVHGDDRLIQPPSLTASTPREGGSSGGWAGPHRLSSTPLTDTDPMFSPAASTWQSEVRRPLRAFRRPILTEIYLCNVCSCQEILRRNGRG